MAGSGHLAVDYSKRRFRAVQVSRSGELLRVRRVLMADIPVSVQPDDPVSLGEWAGDLLRKAGFPRGKAVFAIPRDQVSLKRLTLPTTDRYELPDMVRLTMQRDLPFDPSEAVIDFVPVMEVGAGNSGVSGAGVSGAGVPPAINGVAVPAGGGTVVLVAAIQRRTIEHVREVAKAAGLRIERLSLRCMGLATVVRTLNETTDDNQTAWLGIDVTGDGVELMVLSNGSVRFSRAAEVPHAEDARQFADAVVTETRRSWMSYRVVEDAPEISGAFVVGDSTVTRLTHEQIGDLMNVRTEVLTTHPRIIAGEHELAGAWSLAGLLLEPIVGAPSFDFLNPRRAPDRNARVRQYALAASGALLLLAVGAYGLAHRGLSDMRSRLAGLSEQIRAETPGHYEYEREYWRLQHLDRWGEARVNWLEHLLQLEGRLPDRSQLVLDGWAGSQRFNGVQYNDRATDAAKRWSVPREIIISLEGEAASQAVVDRFRQQFVQTQEYQARPAGPDTSGGKRYPFPFKLTLRTSVGDPSAGEADGAPTGSAGSGGATARRRNGGERGESL